MFLVKLKPTEPIREPITKFGGQPVWLTAPQWPISRSVDKPMRFICQLKLSESLRVGGQEMAYIFMSDDEPQYVESTWEPEAGENAVILQPAPFQPLVETRPVLQGRTLVRMVPGVTGNRLVPQEVEYAADLQDMPDEASQYDEYRLCTRIGGPAGWLQSDETPQSDCRFLMQIDSASAEYSVNFGGAGVGYVFASHDGRRARFLWQCC